MMEEVNDLGSLKPRYTPGAQVEPKGVVGWKLEMPPGPAGHYRLAQVDDYGRLQRQAYPWSPPLRISLRGRVSARDIPGTWGFGLWNNPFGIAVWSGVERIRLPALPQAAWYFFASEASYLALKDDLPAHGQVASVFRSVSPPAGILALGLPLLPLLAVPVVARLLRRLARTIVQQEAVELAVDPTAWHKYEMQWREHGVTFWVDGEVTLESGVSPVGPLALVMWVDNQYMRLPSDGRIHFGTQGSEVKAWVEIDDLVVSET